MTQPSGEGPTQDELVEAIRTLVALASCWLDRDPDPKGVDAQQAAALRDIVRQLSKIAEAQRLYAEANLAVMFRDDLAIALGAKAATNPGGGTQDLGRRERDPGLPNIVPRDFDTSKVVDPRKPRGLTRGERVALAIRWGFLTWHNRTQWGQRERVGNAVDDGVLGDLVERAMRLADNRDARLGATGAASVIVCDLLGLDGRGQRRKADPDVQPQSIAKRFDRMLRARHVDRVIRGRSHVDFGAYFGARDTAEPSAENRAARNSRAWSASALLAAVADGGVALAEAIFDARRDFANQWHVWRDAASGHPTRPFKVYDLYDFEHAMQRFTRGLPVVWPADTLPKSAIARENLAKYLSETEDHALTLWRAGVANLQAMTNGDRTVAGVADSIAVGAMRAAATSLGVSTSRNPLIWLEEAIDATKQTLGPEVDESVARLAVVLANEWLTHVYPIRATDAAALCTAISIQAANIT